MSRGEKRRFGARVRDFVDSFGTQWPEYLLASSTVVGILVVVVPPEAQWVPAAVAAIMFVVGLVYRSRRRDSYWDLTRKIAALEDIEGDRQAALQGLIVALLQGLAETTGTWSHDARASLYSQDGDSFVMIGRRSTNPILQAPGRSVYPVSEGVIGKAWREGQCSVVDLSSDPEERAQRMHDQYDLPLSVGRVLKMSSLSMVAVRIDDSRTDVPIGVIVLESEQKRGVIKSTISAMRGNNPFYKALKVLMSTSSELLPKLDDASKRGF